MANRLVIPIIADSALFKAGLKESEAAATQFETKIKGTATHVKSHVLGIGAAFIGVGGLVSGLGAAIGAAEDLEKSSRALNAQLTANGESLKAIQPQLAGLESNMAKLGITGSQTEQAFTRLDRASGSSATAFKYMGLTANLAAAKHMDLSAAALIVGKVIDGNVGILNRQGIAIAKGTSATDALAIATKKLAGQAEANATPMEKFHATLTNIEAIIGQKLLPTINKYLTIVSDWLGKSDNQRKITDLVSAALKGLGAVVDALKATFERIWPVVLKVHDLFGSWKPLIVGVGVALVALGVLAPWTALAVGAVYVITHWDKVKGWFEAFWVTLQRGFKIAWDAIKADAYVAALQVVEPFSHLPGALGGWARKAKTSLLDGISGLSADMQKQIDGITSAWSTGGHAAGKAWSDAAAKAMSKGGITYGPGGAPMSAIPGAVPSTPSNPQGIRQGALAPSGIHSLLKQAGATDREAAYLTAISGREDASGSPTALNDSLKTHDYSVGLFQINFRDMQNQWMRGGKAAATKLAQDPLAQAKYALGLLHGQGPTAWSTNTPAIQALLGPSGGVAGASHTGATALPGDAAAAAAAAKAQDAAAKKAAAAAKAAASAAYRSWKENYFTPLDNQYKADTLVTDEAARMNKLQALHAKLAIDLKKTKGQEHQDILMEEDKVQGAIQSLRVKMAAQETALGQKQAAEQKKLMDKQAADQAAALAKQHAAYVKSLQADLSAAQSGLSRQQTLFDRAFAKIAAGISGSFTDATQAGLAAIAGKYSAATPEEQARDAFQAQLDAAHRAADLATANDDLIAAQLSGDPAAIKSAQAKLGDIQNQQKLQDLQDAADKSRAIANAASDQEKTDYQKARDEQLSNLNSWLEDQKSALEGGTQTWDGFWQGAFSDAPEKYAPDAVGSLQGIIDQQQKILALQAQIDGATGNNSSTASDPNGFGGSGMVSLPGGIKVPAGLLGHGFGGGFADGGVVPGSLGQPMLILAHGGETVTPVGGTAGGGDTFVFNFPNYVGDKRELMDLVRSEANRIAFRNGSSGIN